jgi:hypothetical protein
MDPSYFKRGNILMSINSDLDALALRTDAGQGEVMLRKVYDFLGRFIAYPSEHAHVAHALWIVHAHLMDAWESTPRIAFLSAEPASGKSRALEATELLVPNPVAAVNVSPAYLFRKVGCEEGATILFDEIDTVFGPKAKENEELRGLLNAGHRRGAVAGRCVVKGKEIMTEEIPAYAAVALAGLGWLPDTILTRSVVIRMRRRHEGEHVEPFRRRIHGAQGHDIHNLVDVWARAIESSITWPNLPPEIQDRDADVWEPLIAVADAVGGTWPKRSREAAVAIVAESKDREPSLGIRLLADVRTVFGDSVKMTSKAILAALHAMDEAPWKDLKGKPLDERGLANRLRQYSVKPKSIPVGEARPRGYVRADLYDAWVRYLPPIAAKSATSATSTTSVEKPTENVADDLPYVADVALHVADGVRKNGNNLNAVADVADVADFRGNGGDDVPEFLRRCDHCGQPATSADPLNPYDWSNGRTVRLHHRCEGPFYDDPSSRFNGATSRGARL